MLHNYHISIEICTYGILPVYRHTIFVLAYLEQSERLNLLDSFEVARGNVSFCCAVLCLNDDSGYSFTITHIIRDWFKSTMAILYKETEALLWTHNRIW